MEKNRSYGPSVRAGGARYAHDRGIGAGTNGYGINSDAPFSKGVGSYTPAQNLPPINGDGMENFRGEPRFTGDMGGQTRVQASASGQKDSIETMGKSDEQIARSY